MWGVEVDGSWSTAEGQATRRLAIGAGANPLRGQQTNERWLTTARGRLGYACGQVAVVRDRRRRLDRP